jgi:hypothetical protein
MRIRVRALFGNTGGQLLPDKPPTGTVRFL